MYCKYCGKEIADDSIFCKYCGKQLSVELEIPNSDISNQQINNKKDKSKGHQKLENNRLAKSIVIRCGKEFFYILLFFVSAFAIAYFGKSVFITAYTPPVISEEKQREFNDSVDYRSRPWQYDNLTYEEYQEASRKAYDAWSKDIHHMNKYIYAHRNDYYIGDILPLIGYGEWKFDEGFPFSELSHINEVRQAKLNIISEDFYQILFWSVLVGFITIRYLYLLIKWLTKKE